MADDTYFEISKDEADEWKMAISRCRNETDRRCIQQELRDEEGLSGLNRRHEVLPWFPGLRPDREAAADRDRMNGDYIRA